MRTLENYEIPFWNETSLDIIIDAGFIVEINNGLITGIEFEGNELK